MENTLENQDKWIDTYLTELAQMIETQHKRLLRLEEGHGRINVTVRNLGVELQPSHIDQRFENLLERQKERMDQWTDAVIEQLKKEMD